MLLEKNETDREILDLQSFLAEETDQEIYIEETGDENSFVINLENSDQYDTILAKFSRSENLEEIEDKAVASFDSTEVVFETTETSELEYEIKMVSEMSNDPSSDSFRIEIKKL